MLARLLDHLKLAGMLIYDDEDSEITPAQFEKMGRLWRGARVHSPRGLGHNHILEDGAVIDAITGFLRDG